MKRLTVITALSILAVWVTLIAFAVSPAEAKSDKILIKFHDEIGSTPKTIQSAEMAVAVICLNMKIAPVFDATGAVVSDPTGTMLNPNHSGCTAVSVTGGDVKIAPIFNTKGVVVSDPTGTILNSNQSGDLAFPVTGGDMKIAPVFDATGAVVSDPTGTISNMINP